MLRSLVTEFYALLMRAFFTGVQWWLQKPLVLLFRNAGIGDIVCTFPAATALKQRHPGCAFIYCCHRDLKALPRMAELFDGVVGVKCADFLAERLRGAFITYAFSYGDERPDDFSSAHLVDEFCRQFDVTPTSRQPRLHVPERTLRKVRAILGGAPSLSAPLVTFQTGPSWPVREWPAASWQRLIDRLRENSFPRILRLGSARHLILGTAEMTPLQNVEDFVGKLGLAGTIAALKLSTLFIGIDSGLLHLAGAVGTPVVGLFGPTNPALRMPLETPGLAPVAGLSCQFCHHQSSRLHWQTGCPYDAQCMKQIPVESVLEAITTLTGRAVCERSEQCS